MTVRTVQLPDDLPRLAGLFAATEHLDGYFPLGEEAHRDLLAGPDLPGLVDEEDGTAAGYAHLRAAADALVIDVAVHPEASPHTPRRLLAAAVGGAAGRPIVVWGSHREIVVAARALGFVEQRRLLHMTRPLPAADPGPLPGGVDIAVFVADRDEEAVLEVNNAAFIGHPDNDGWSRSDLEERMARPWFDPEGLYLARTDGRVIGVCWTKLHPGGVGEIYLVAVHPDHQGRSLGRWLTLRGLDHLHTERNAHHGMLYTESTNAVARGLYDSLGFGVVRVKRLLERR